MFSMRTDLDHLPPAKQRELERVVQILFEEFEAANEAATGKRAKARIRKIILYGSYARGGWVDEPHTAKGYQSDFDLLIIVNQKELTDRATYWYKADERLMRERAITGRLKTPVNFIVHTLQEVNDGLAHGRFFFMDVAKEGIALYAGMTTRRSTSPSPRRPTRPMRWPRSISRSGFRAPVTLDMRDCRYRHWRSGLKKARISTCTKRPSASTTACCWSAPSTRRTTTISPSCAPRPSGSTAASAASGRWTRRERAMFEKLKDAYVKARYSKLCRARHSLDYAERRTMPHVWNVPVFRGF